jgi:hypothetical protein
MPITAWDCPNCHKAVPLDHFAATPCGGTVHPDYAAAVLADRELQAERSGVRVSALTACPRKGAIMHSEDIAVNPLDMLTAMKGTAWHTLMERGAEFTDNPARDAAVLSDGEIGAEISVRGEIAGVPVTGTIDRVRRADGKLVGEDHKTGKDARAVFIRGGKSYGKQIAGQGAPAEYRVQLSIYSELYAQQFGRAWDSAAIWWWFSAEAWREPIELMSVEQCLAYKPYDCDFTVAELLQQAHAVHSGAVKWQDLPLVGRSIKFGTKIGCDYCEVREVCWTEADGAPF